MNKICNPLLFTISFIINVFINIQCLNASELVESSNTKAAKTIQKYWRQHLDKRQKLINLYKEAVKYRNGEIEGFPKDKEHTLIKTASLFLPLAHQGYSNAMHNFAVIQEKRRNYASSLKWFQRAAHKGLTPSLNNILTLYQKIGKYTLIQEIEAQKFYIKKIKDQLKERFNISNSSQELRAVSFTDIFSNEITLHILTFLSPKDLVNTQLASQKLRELGALSFRDRARQITFSPASTILPNDKEQSDKRAVFQDMSLKNGYSLLNSIYLGDKEAGIKILINAAEIGSLKACRKIISKAPIIYTNENRRKRQKIKAIVSSQIKLLEEKVDSLPLTHDDKSYMITKYKLKADPTPAAKQQAFVAFLSLAGRKHAKACYRAFQLTKERSYLDVSATQGYKKAQFNLAHLLQQEGNLTQAKIYYKLAANQGLKEAQNNIAYLLNEEQIYTQAEHYYRLAADQGLEAAQLVLAQLLFEKGDRQQARRYYELAADQGNVIAQSNLACLLDINKEYQVEAKIYYKLAADQGDKDAQCRLASLFEQDKDIASAKQYYKLAADQGHSIAQIRFAELLEQEKNIAQAKDYYKPAAVQGNSEAQNSLGIFAFKEGDFVQAKKFFKLAADQGDISAIINLAHLFEREGDFKEAEYYYKTGADLGSPDAQNKLGMLICNRGDSNEGKQYLRLAAAQGLRSAQFNLGYLSEKSGNLIEATHYYQLAAEQGDKDAQNKLKMLARIKIKKSS